MDPNPSGPVEENMILTYREPDTMTDNEDLERAIQEQITDHLQIAAAEMERARKLAGQENPVSGDMTSIRTWILGLIDSQEPDRDVDLEIYTQEYDGGRRLVHVLKETDVDEEDMNFLNTLDDIMDRANEEVKEDNEDDEDEKEQNAPGDAECEACMVDFGDDDEDEEYEQFLA